MKALILSIVLCVIALTCSAQCVVIDHSSDLYLPSSKEGIEQFLSDNGYTYWPQSIRALRNNRNGRIIISFSSEKGISAFKDTDGKWTINNAEEALETMIIAQRQSWERYRELEKKYDHTLDVIRKFSAHRFSVDQPVNQQVGISLDIGDTTQFRITLN